MRVVRIAARQHGCVSTPQLAAARVSRAVLARWVAKGWLLRRHRGVYVVGPLESPHTRAMAALLAAGTHAVLSHRAAATLYDLLPAHPGPIDVTVSRPGPRSRPGIHVHVATDLPHNAVRHRHAMPVTSPDRTIRDLARVLTTHELDRVVEEAVLRRMIEPSGNAEFTRSEAERRMLDLIRAAGLPRPLVNTVPARTRSTCCGRSSASSWRSTGTPSTPLARPSNAIGSATPICRRSATACSA